MKWTLNLLVISENKFKSNRKYWSKLLITALQKLWKSIFLHSSSSLVSFQSEKSLLVTNLQVFLYFCIYVNCWKIKQRTKSIQFKKILTKITFSWDLENSNDFSSLLSAKCFNVTNALYSFYKRMLKLNEILLRKLMTLPNEIKRNIH